MADLTTDDVFLYESQKVHINQKEFCYDKNEKKTFAIY